MRWLKRILAATAVLVILLAAAVFGIVKLQGSVSREFPDAAVKFDAHGIPTVEAKDWNALIEAQGFVVASQRLFQMDLIRRKAGGRLAEFFGVQAFDHDLMVQREDRLDLSRKAADSLPPDEREPCDRYAKGVNRFITENPWRVGLEYHLLQTKPEPWTCADSLLVLLEMSDVLTSAADREAENFAWRRNLSDAWQAYLFPVDHPWNHPYFGSKTAEGPAVPPVSEYLPRKPLGPERGASLGYADPGPVGSNNWGWRGPTGAFLANDPHLGNAVPSIWYAMRLRVSPTEWVVGAAIPGLPGIVVGMNPALAWAFTNTGEDVDDYLRESPETSFTTKTFRIRVKGEKTPREVTSAFTANGPISERDNLGKDLYSRQWLPLKPGMLRLPTVQFMRTRTVEEFDKAVDSMVIPSQNILMMTHAGDMGYRMSGTGVVRKVSGRIPQPAADGAWLGLEPAASRPRLYYKDEGDQVRYLASANERIWIDPFGAQWASDDRKDRIVRYLSSRQDFKREDMEKLQVDTEGRFRQLLMTWVASKSSVSSGPAADYAKTFIDWDGSSRTNPELFTASTLAEQALTRILLDRVKETFKNDADRGVDYAWYMRRAWLLSVLEAPGDQGLAPFGLTSEEVARRLLDTVLDARGRGPLHPETNRWKGQHPFTRLPVVGRLFAVEEIPQWGAHDLVDAEAPTFGPSTRLVWDLRKPWESTWAFPVGQSGHVGASHYADAQDLWKKDQRLKVFDDGFAWEFIGRSR